MLEAFASAVRARFGDRVAAVELYGSRARGEGHEDSDLDVLVLLRDLKRDDRSAVIDIAFDLELREGLVLSPLVKDPAVFRWDRPLGVNIAKDGVPL